MTGVQAIEAEGLEIQPFTGLPHGRSGIIPRGCFLGDRSHASMPQTLRFRPPLIKRVTVLAIDHCKTNLLHSVTAGLQGLATDRWRLPWLPCPPQGTNTLFENLPLALTKKPSNPAPTAPPASGIILAMLITPFSPAFVTRRNPTRLLISIKTLPGIC